MNFCSLNFNSNWWCLENKPSLFWEFLFVFRVKASTASWPPNSFIQWEWWFISVYYIAKCMVEASHNNWSVSPCERWKILMQDLIHIKLLSRFRHSSHWLFHLTISTSFFSSKYFMEMQCVKRCCVQLIYLKTKIRLQD